MPASTPTARILQCRFAHGTRRLSKSVRRSRLLIAAALATTITAVLFVPGTALASQSFTEGQPSHVNFAGKLTLNCSWGGDPNEFTYPQCPFLESGPDVIINWGDGTGMDSSTGTATLGSCGFDACDYTIAGSHIYRAGQYQISYSVTYSWLDAGLIENVNTVSGSDSASVADVPLAIQQTDGLSQTVGGSPALTLANLSDADPTAISGNYTISIDWGDGSGSQGGSAVATGAPGGFAIRGSHAYSKIGNYTATVTVVDYGGAPAVTTHTSVAVTPASLALTAASGLTATADESTGQLQLATLTDTNPLATAGDLHATVAWGDGTTSAAHVTALAPGRFSVIGAHTYASPGNFTASIAVDDGNGSHPTAATTISVAPAHDVICATAANGIHGSEGSPLPPAPLARFADTNPNLTKNDFTTSVAWGDGTPPTTATVTPTTGLQTPCGGPAFDADGTHTYAEAGIYTVTVSIADHSGAISQVTTTILVADQALTTRGAPALLLKRGQFSGTVVVARFSDANPLGHVSDYRATIDWGDGTPSTAGVAVADGGKGYAVTGDHTYNSIGTHRITVSVFDRGGATASAQTTAVVRPVPVSGGVRENFESTGDPPYYSIVATLLVHDAATGSRVLVRCHGHGCPYARKAMNVKHGSLNLAHDFRHKHLTPGSHFSVALTDPGWCGKYWAFRVRAAALPADVGPISLAPGATRPGKGC